MNHLEAELKAYLVKEGMTDGNDMVPGVRNKWPKAEEFLDYWVPRINDFFTTYLQSLEVEQQEHYAVHAGTSAASTAVACKCGQIFTFTEELNGHVQWQLAQLHKARSKV